MNKFHYPSLGRIVYELNGVHIVTVNFKPNEWRLKLDNGGAFTPLLKTRMNKALELQGFDIRVRQKQGHWYLDDGISLKPFNRTVLYV